MTKKRAYCFTLNNYTDEECALIAIMCEELPVRYLVCGFEVGEQGTPHLQGYVYMENAVQITYFKDFMPRAHFIESKGDPEQNYAYCTKDSDAYVYGEMPIKGRATWDKIVDAMKDPRSNPHLYNQYHKAYSRINNADRAMLKHKIELMEIDFIEEVQFEENETIGMYDTYDGEDVCVMDKITYTYNKLRIKLALQGIPMKVKRGYEMITFNPKVILVVKNDLII